MPTSTLDLAAPPEIRVALHGLGVIFRQVDISYRLPRGTVASFGNQFYVLDVIREFASQADSGALVLTDCDCIWRRSVTGLEAAPREHECLLYTLAPADQKGYEVGNIMNGMTHARMSEIGRREFGLSADHQVQYHGGEFFAATGAFCRRMQPRVGDLWKIANSKAALPDGIKEEAHFLSILTEGLCAAPSTANSFVRRIWTNFEDLNAVSADQNLTLWHLPSEKHFCFRRLWLYLERSGRELSSFTPEEVNQITEVDMGVPRRSARKLILDIAQKILSAYASKSIKKSKGWRGMTNIPNQSHLFLQMDPTQQISDGVDASNA